MTKLLILSPVLYAFWNYTTYALLAIILAVFLIDLISRLRKKEQPSKSNYEVDNITSEDINLAVDSDRGLIDIKCEALNLEEWSYSDIQTMCRLHRLRPKNRKKDNLISELSLLIN